MLESIFSNVLAALGEMLNYVVSVLLSCISFDVTKFAMDFPVVEALYLVLRGVGFGLVISVAIYQLIRFAAGPLTDTTETPMRIIARSFMGCALILGGNHLLVMVCNLFSYPYADMLGVNVSGTSATLSQIISNVSLIDMAAASGGAVSQLALVLLPFIFLLMLGWNLIKLILEVVERYLWLMSMIYTSPLGWAMVTSSATAGIFRQWLKMFFSQCAMMLFNVWSFKMVLSVLGGTPAADGGTGLIMRLIFAVTFCKLAQRIDTYLNQLGANPAITGQNMVDDIMALRAPLSKGGRALAGMFGGGRGAGGKNTPPSGDSAAKQAFSTPFSGQGLFRNSPSVDGADVAGVARAAGGGVAGMAGAAETAAMTGEPISSDDALAMNAARQRATALTQEDKVAYLAAKAANGGMEPSLEQIQAAKQDVTALNKDLDAAGLHMENGAILPDGRKTGTRDVENYAKKAAVSPATSLQSQAVANTLLSGASGRELAKDGIMGSEQAIKNDVVGAAAVASLLRGAVSANGGSEVVPATGAQAQGQMGAVEGAQGNLSAQDFQSGAPSVASGNLATDASGVQSTPSNVLSADANGTQSEALEQFSTALQATAQASATESTGYVSDLTAGNGEISGTYTPPTKSEPLVDEHTGEVLRDEDGKPRMSESAQQAPQTFSVLSSSAFAALPSEAQSGYQAFKTADGQTFCVRMAEAQIVPPANNGFGMSANAAPLSAQPTQGAAMRKQDRLAGSANSSLGSDKNHGKINNKRGGRAKRNDRDKRGKK